VKYSEELSRDPRHDFTTNSKTTALNTNTNTRGQPQSVSLSFLFIFFLFFFMLAAVKPLNVAVLQNIE